MCLWFSSFSLFGFDRCLGMLVKILFLLYEMTLMGVFQSMSFVFRGCTVSDRSSSLVRFFLIFLDFFYGSLLFLGILILDTHIFPFVSVRLSTVKYTLRLVLRDVAFEGLE